MHATPDRYLETNLKSNGSGLLQVNPPRVAPLIPSSPNARPSQEPAHRPMKLGRILVGILILMAVGFVAGLLPRLHNKHVTQGETNQLSLGTVRVTKPAPSKSAEPISLSGELRPLMEAPIYARASGYVRKWNVDLGARVEEGQVIAELDTPEIDRELAEARAGLKQAAASADLAETTAKRWKQLLAGKSVSAQDTDEKTGDFAVKTQALASARANVERLEKLTGFGKIEAPFAGTVTARRLDVGQLVNAGNSQELFRIADISKLRLFVRVPQTFARAVHEGQKAEITMAELPGRKFEARVVRTAGAIDAASRTLLTEMEIDNARNELLAGSYVQVRLAETLPEAALTVSSNALIFRSEGPQIAVVNDQNRIELRKVSLGRDFGTALEIFEGVKPEDRVVVNPPDSLVEGIEVRIVQDTPAGEPAKAR